MLMKRKKTVKNTAPATSQIKTKGTFTPSPKGSVKKITFITAAVIGAMTLLIASSTV